MTDATAHGRDTAPIGGAEPLVIALDRHAPTPIELTLHRTAAAGAPAYLVMPAMGTPAAFYTGLLRTLAAGGVHAGVVELRGHQRAGAPAPGRRHDHGYRELADDLAAGIRAVRERLPGARVVVLGHSMGGQVTCAQAGAAAAAGDESAAPDALALVGSGSIAWSSWDGGPSLHHLVRTQAAGLLTRTVGHFPGSRVGFAGREAPTQMLEWARWARTGRFVIGEPPVDAGEQAARITAPVLALSFARDRLSPRSATDALAAMLTGAPVTREHLALEVGRAHFGWVRDRDRVIPRLVRWATTLT